MQRVKWEHGCAQGNPCGHRHAGHCPERHGGGLVASEVKSRSGKRTIGLPLPLVKVLTEHCEQQKLEIETTGNLWNDEGWVFANQVGRAIHPSTDQTEWKALLKAAGVRDARLHDARHTTATMLLILGVPSRAVMDVMGWSNVALTTRYQHITPELTTSIANQIGDLLWTDQGKADDEDDGEAPMPAAV